MKISKILPLALAMLLATTSVFADGYTNGKGRETSEMTITVPKYLNIEKYGEVATSSVTNFDTHYAGINLDTAMTVSFKVSNNYDGQLIYLRATAISDSGEKVALGGTAASPVIVFANQDHQPTQAAIENAFADTSAMNLNANAIGFKITRTLDTEAGDHNAASSPAAETLISDTTGKQVQYTLKNGIYTFKYDIAQTAKTNTFSTHDQDGTYKATLILTNVAGA